MEERFHLNPSVTPTGFGVPDILPGDPRRQAVHSIHGTVYQAWCSIDAWLYLSEADEVIYLEGAEDYDVVRNDTAIVVQVKRNTDSISLGTTKALTALENFWTLSCKEANRIVDFHYLTTSEVAKEQGHNFNGYKGIEIWPAAGTNPELAKAISSYLIDKLDINSPLRAFLISTPIETIQERFLRRFHWFTKQGDLDSVKRSVDNRITLLLSSQRRSLTLVQNVRNYIESRFWELILERPSDQRCLTRAELLRVEMVRNSETA